MATPHEQHDLDHYHPDHGNHGRDQGRDDHSNRGHHPRRGVSAVNERLARFLFDLQADDYDAQDAMRELAWADDNIRGFWLDQADAVVSFLELDAA